MNENLWSILTEFTHPCTSASFEGALSVMKTGIEPLKLPEMFLQRLNFSLMETITNHVHQLDESQTTSMVKIRILSNYSNPEISASPSSWGFFFIEKDQEIELYLYQDSK